MIRAVDVVVDGEGRAGAGGRDEDVVDLIYDDRHRRRLRLTTRSGERVLLDLGDAIAIPDGARLVLEDGRRVLVCAAPEPLLEVRARDPLHLARLAWHLGNRHVAADIGAERILIREDHVLADMLKGLGAAVARVAAPFAPESGAYAHQQGGHGSRHTHDPAHDGDAGASDAGGGGGDG